MLVDAIFHWIPLVFGFVSSKSAVLYARRCNISLNSLRFVSLTFKNCCTVCSDIQYVMEFLWFWRCDLQKVLYRMLRHSIFHWILYVLTLRASKKLCTVCSDIQYFIEFLRFWSWEIQKVLYCMFIHSLFLLVYNAFV